MSTTLFDPSRLHDGVSTGPTLTTRGLGYRHRRRLPGSAHAWELHDVDLTLRSGTVTGLLGRNGAGKSTLLDLLAGLRRPRTGEVLLDGEPVWDGPGPRAAVTLLGTRRALLENNRLTDSVELWRTTRPLWSSTDLARYLDSFEVNVDCVPRRLSQGQRSAVDAAFALASHSPVLLLDEVHLGMDAVVRRRFWDALLEQYVAERATIVIAAHEVAEIEDLLEDVVVLADGTVTAAGSADDLRAACTPPGAPLADLTDVLEHYSAKGA